MLTVPDSTTTSSGDGPDLSELACYGTDREWFDATANCGHCGIQAAGCTCTSSDPCGCGPHTTPEPGPRAAGPNDVPLPFEAHA